MKKIILTIFIVVSSIVLFAQPIPPDSFTHGEGGNQPAGGGAPIDGGLGILLLMSAVYGIKELYIIKKKKY